MEEESTVRILNLEEASAMVYRERSPAKKAQDQILDQAEKAAREALERSEEAIEWLEALTPVESRRAPVYVRQLLEEILEVRRLRG